MANFQIRNGTKRTLQNLASTEVTKQWRKAVFVGFCGCWNIRGPIDGPPYYYPGGDLGQEGLLTLLLDESTKIWVNENEQPRKSSWDVQKR